MHVIQRVPHLQAGGVTVDLLLHQHVLAAVPDRMTDLPTGLRAHLATLELDRTLQLADERRLDPRTADSLDEVQLAAQRGATVIATAKPGDEEAFVRGLETLRRAIDARAPGRATLEAVFHDLSGFWEQSHHVRAAGSFLLDAARAVGVLDAVERTATFTIDDATLVLR